MLRKRLTISLVTIGLLVAGFFIFNELTSYQNLTVNLASTLKNPTVTVYRVPDADEVSNPELKLNDKKIAEKLSDTKTLKLKKGRYYIVGKAENTVDFGKAVTLDKKPNTVEINPWLNDKALDALLSTEQPAVIQVIKQKYPVVDHGYVLRSGKLYGNGDWYGVTLLAGSNPNVSGYVDVFRVVAKKENGTWVIKTTVPELVVSSKSYPDIPHDILVKINKL